MLYNIIEILLASTKEINIKILAKYSEQFRIKIGDLFSKLAELRSDENQKVVNF